jgi:hypothetical protein
LGFAAKAHWHSPEAFVKIAQDTGAGDEKTRNFLVKKKKRAF